MVHMPRNVIRSEADISTIILHVLYKLPLQPVMISLGFGLRIPPCRLVNITGITPGECFVPGLQMAWPAKHCVMFSRSVKTKNNTKWFI